MTFNGLVFFKQDAQICTILRKTVEENYNQDP